MLYNIYSHYTKFIKLCEYTTVNTSLQKSISKLNDNVTKILSMIKKYES